MILSVSLAFFQFTALPALAAMDSQPCCAVVAIDKASGVVTVRDKSTGQYARLKVTDAAKLETLQTGQEVDAKIGIPLGAGLNNFGKDDQ